MSRKRATVDIASVFAAIPLGDGDDLDDKLLDAAEWLLRERGLRGWTLDDVVDRSGVGRTTVYRRFGGRDDLVHAVLARELRVTLRAIQCAADEATGLEDKAVAGVVTALACLDGAVVDSLLRSDPDTFLPFLTADAGPLIALATNAIAASLVTYLPEPSLELAEAAARLGLSFVLTRESTLPIGDPVALDAAVRRMVRPLLMAFENLS